MEKRRAHLCRKWKLAIIPAVAILATALVGLTDVEEERTLRISEVCPHNFNLAADCRGNYSDYIELYNEGDVAINLSDYYLSDDHGNQTRFKLPDIELNAGEYIIVWADSTGTACGHEGEVHANFRLSDGETVLLSVKGGNVIDAVELGSFADNVSVTKLNGEFVKAYGTPGVKNDGCELYREPVPNTPAFVPGDENTAPELIGYTLRISEVCPHNFNLAANCCDEFSDYIELCNEGNAAINLSDYCLSDDLKNPARFELPDIELEAGEHIIIWADGTDGACGHEGEIHANFRLSDGETVILTVKGAGLVDAVELDILADNVSVTKLAGEFVKAYGTPGVENDGCVLYQAASLDMPVFSLESGFYFSDSITLEIEVPQGVTVYYTTDGSIPDVNSAVYVGALVLTDVSKEPNRYVNIKNTIPDYNTHKVNNDPVNKANVIRAIAVDDQGNFSVVKTATYFVGESAKEYEGYAVLSIVSDPDGLFGDDGICVTGKAYDEWYNNTNRSAKAPTANFLQHGKLWERTATIQLWDANGNLVLDQDCGIRVQGNTWRKQAVKRFSFYARNHYSGSNLFDASIFSSGQLTHSFYTRSDVADMISHDLVADRELAVQEGIPTVCFLDGELYSVTYIRERHDSTFFEERYGVAEEDIVVITCGELDEGTTEDLAEYREFINFVTNADMTNPAVYAKLEERMDVQSFIDFMVANMYCNNFDVAINQNFKMWRSRTSGGEGYCDGKWRVASYDMDGVAWSYGRVEDHFLACNPFKYTLGTSEKYGAGFRKCIYIPFFQNLLKNKSFEERFITTYLDMMNTNFSMKSYGGEVLSAYGDTQSWLWPVLLTERHSYTIEHLQLTFDLTGVACPVTVEKSGGGVVRVNTTEAYAQDGVWHATYISGMEMTFTAVAEAGWRFVGWQGDLVSSGECVSVLLGEEGISLKAVFVREGEE